MPLCSSRSSRSLAPWKRPTPTERLLWRHLCGKQLGVVRVRRQHPLHPFIVDFFVASSKLVVEVDGEVHREAAVRARDTWRTGELVRLYGVCVLRIDADLVASTRRSRSCVPRSGELSVAFSRGATFQAPHAAVVRIEPADHHTRETIDALGHSVDAFGHSDDVLGHAVDALGHSNERAFHAFELSRMHVQLARVRHEHLLEATKLERMSMELVRLSFEQVGLGFQDRGHARERVLDAP